MWAWIAGLGLVANGSAALGITVRHQPLTDLVSFTAGWAITTGLGIIILSVVPWRRT
jgi:hypothetical protein